MSQYILKLLKLNMHSSITPLIRIFRMDYFYILTLSNYF